ncbi:MarR family transcriptional regulator [Phycicoccus sp. HDW14]|uniref:MarR family winged helix-turn-helix transcriptional regulator n=1 Tax=Phycicoccus sp. HDW14 TaxID=2714941 RepID=UPI00140E9502|nr:MarR family transcriptional regulator [Phycicoccus sp. HDW14]QIM20214.1 MarR family transcriptional regulator [Phycicoccus sp. HDW14]
MSPEVHPLLPADPSVRLFRVVLTLATHLRTRMDQRLGAVDLTTQQAGVLTFVSAHPGSPTLGEVARALGTSHQNARQVVAALERKDLLEVRADASDGRVRRLAVTHRVAATFAERDLEDHQEVRRWLAPLTDDEQRHVAALLTRVLAELGSAQGRGTRGP